MQRVSDRIHSRPAILTNVTRGFQQMRFQVIVSARKISLRSKRQRQTAVISSEATNLLDAKDRVRLKANHKRYVRKNYFHNFWMNPSLSSS